MAIQVTQVPDPGMYKFQTYETGQTQDGENMYFVGGTANPFSFQVMGNGTFGGSGLFGNDDPASTLSCTGDIIAFLGSDIRWKTNIIPIVNPIEKIKSIGGYTYNWKDNARPHNRGKKDVGVLAQEIEKILPEIVREDKEGYKSLQYDKIIPLLIECIKDQQKQIDELKESIKV